MFFSQYFTTKLIRYSKELNVLIRSGKAFKFCDLRDGI